MAICNRASVVEFHHRGMSCTLNEPWLNGMPAHCLIRPSVSGAYRYRSIVEDIPGQRVFHVNVSGTVPSIVDVPLG
jgi:hypothetical protein